MGANRSPLPRRTRAVVCRAQNVGQAAAAAVLATSVIAGVRMLRLPRGSEPPRAGIPRPKRRRSKAGTLSPSRAAPSAIRSLSSLTSQTQAANALTFDELQSLTYLQVKGSGLANTCPVLSTGSTNLKDLKSGSYKLERFCMEPTSFSVKEESQFKGGESGFTKTKLMTRLTYTLDGVRPRGRPGRCGAASLKPAVL